jgi:hypothetical protein
MTGGGGEVAAAPGTSNKTTYAYISYRNLFEELNSKQFYEKIIYR